MKGVEPMRRAPVLALLTLILTLAGPVSAEQALYRFLSGSTSGPQAERPEVAPTGLVAALLEPGDTGLGHTLGNLLWNELRTVLSAPDAGRELLLQGPGERPLAARLGQEYHRAAVQLARSYGASMVLWGAVLEQDGRLLVDSHLTLLPEISGALLYLRLSYDRLGHRSLDAALQRTRLNFAPVETSRAQLFARRLVVRQSTPLRAGPSEATAIVGHVEANAVLQAQDMTRNWFKVQHPGQDGVYAYVEHSHVNVPPRMVEATGTAVKVYAGPGPTHRVLRQGALQGSFEVLDLRYHPDQGLWYRLQVGATLGWVSAASIQPRLSLPVAHFFAGLSHYQAGRYADAARAMTQFISSAGTDADNVNVAIAHQMQGGSRIVGKTVWEVEPLARKAFSQAIALTPYNPDAYILRALATLGGAHTLVAALEDVEQALALDPRDAQARTLFQTLDAMATNQTLLPLHALLSPGRDAQRTLARIRTRFGFVSASPEPLPEPLPQPPPKLPAQRPPVPPRKQPASFRAFFLSPSFPCRSLSEGIYAVASSVPKQVHCYTYRARAGYVPVFTLRYRSGTVDLDMFVKPINALFLSASQLEDSVASMAIGRTSEIIAFPRTFKETIFDIRIYHDSGSYGEYDLIIHLVNLDHFNGAVFLRNSDKNAISELIYSVMNNYDADRKASFIFSRALSMLQFSSLRFAPPTRVLEVYLREVLEDYYRYYRD